MKAGLCAVLAAAALAATASGAAALTYPPRPDVIWARQTTGPITLDGKLNEPAWALAETKTIQYRIPGGNGIPGSGYQEEGGVLATDTMKAVVKFLVVGNQLYMGCKVFDKSIGGSKDFNRFDGLLMNIKNHSTGTYPAPHTEYFYSWWHPENLSLNVAGAQHPRRSHHPRRQVQRGGLGQGRVGHRHLSRAERHPGQRLAGGRWAARHRHHPRHPQVPGGGQLAPPDGDGYRPCREARRG